MSASKGWLVAVLGAAAVMIVIAAKKAAPATASGDPSKTPNSVSSSESTPRYNTLYGVAGVAPLISFPDIGGRSANVTQPV